MARQERWSLDEYKKWIKSNRKARFIPNGNKFNAPATKADKAISCKCWSGHIHNSGAESGYCNTLRLLVQAKDIRGYEIEKSYSLPRFGKRTNRIIIDFIVTNNDGSIEAHEYKGFQTSTWAVKTNWFKSEYPEIPYFVKTNADIF